MKKIYIFHLEEGFFCVFSLHYHVLIENDGKNKKYINFLLQFNFFSQKCINYPLSSNFRRINNLSKKDLYFISEKKENKEFDEKKFLFTEKVNFLMIFCLFHCFHQTINKKNWILPQYTFFYWKNNKWRVFQRF